MTKLIEVLKTKSVENWLKQFETTLTKHWVSILFIPEGDDIYLKYIINWKWELNIYVLYFILFV